MCPILQLGVVFLVWQVQQPFANGMSILSHIPKTGYKFLVLSNLKLNPRSKAIWPGVRDQSSFFQGLQKEWAFLGRQSGLGIERKPNSFGKQAWTAIRKTQSFLCCQLGRPKSRLLNNTGCNKTLEKGSRLFEGYALRVLHLNQRSLHKKVQMRKEV